MTATLELKPIPGTESAPVETPKAPPSVLDIVTNAVNGGADMAALTSLYLKVRNAKSDLSAQAKKRMAPLDESMELLENTFLAKMTEMGVDSLKNANGTPYKTTKTSITTADAPLYVDFVLTRAMAGLPLTDAAKEKIKQAMIDSGAMMLLETRPAKLAVEALVEETKVLPPGLNQRKEFAVNVRAD